MKYLVRSAAAALMVFGFGSYAHAGTINFITLTEQNPGGYGEGAWSELPLIIDGLINVKITGWENDVQKYAYLDWSTAGLGVCRSVMTPSLVNTQDDGRSANNCNPSSDDNVTTNEYLQFVFDRDVRIDKLWFNNNHDGGLGTGGVTDRVTIEQVGLPASHPAILTGYADNALSPFLGPYTVAANDPFKVKFNNEQFYISGMQVTAVPDQATTLGLLSLGILSLFAIKLRVG